jgi:hypothetical protein
MERMYATDQYGMNFRPVDYFSAAGSPQRTPGGGTNYGGSMIPGDQAFMDMLNARYTFPTGALPAPGSVAEEIGQGRLANTLRQTDPTISGVPAMSPVDLNRMRGMWPQFQRENLYGSGFRDVISPPGSMPLSTNMSKAGQFNIGAGLATVPAAARTARGDTEEEFQQRPDLAGQLRRNVRARGSTTGRRGRGTGDTGG